MGAHMGNQEFLNSFATQQQVAFSNNTQTTGPLEA